MLEYGLSLKLRTNKANIRIIGGLIRLRFRSNFFMARISAAIGSQKEYQSRWFCLLRVKN